MKRCSCCGEVKSLDEFHRLQSAKDGRKPACKPCNIRKAREYVESNREKVAQYQAEWSRANPEKRAANVRAWYARDPERARAKARAAAARHVASGGAALWLAANPDKVKAVKTRWKRANRDRVAADQAARRASELRAMPPWVDRAALVAVYTAARASGMSVDHIVPLRHPKVCGLHVPANLQLLSLSENIQKNNRYWPDM